MDIPDLLNLPISLSEKGFRSAFDSVLSGIVLAADIKERLFRALYTGTGYFEDLMRAYPDILAGTEWEWPEFDRCAAEFQAAGQWPAMWYLLHLDEFPRARPANTAQALPWFDMAALKAWLLAHGYRPRPMPKRRTEMESYASENVPWEAIAPDAAARYSAYLAGYHRYRVKNKAKLLAHTVQMALYTSVAQDMRQQAAASFADAGTPFPYQWRVLPSECPVEQSWGDRFNRGDIRRLPPFFPGDRSCPVMSSATDIG